MVSLSGGWSVAHLGVGMEEGGTSSRRGFCLPHKLHIRVTEHTGRHFPHLGRLVPAARLRAGVTVTAVTSRSILPAGGDAGGAADDHQHARSGLHRRPVPLLAADRLRRWVHARHPASQNPSSTTTPHTELLELLKHTESTQRAQCQRPHRWRMGARRPRRRCACLRALPRLPAPKPWRAAAWRWRERPPAATGPGSQPP